jgi:hypothetical protein
MLSPDCYETVTQAIVADASGPHYWLVSSTVTTTTVAVVTTAVSSGLAATFSLLAVALLAILLVGREVVQYGQGGGVKRLARGLDIATLPLILAFAVIVGIGLRQG